MEEKWLYLTVTNIHLLPFNPTYVPLAKGLIRRQVFAPGRDSG